MMHTTSPAATASPPIETFRVDIDERVIDDLRSRLSAVRWTSDEVAAGWNDGTNPVYLRELCRYWERAYDWRKHQAELNALPHFKTDVDNVALHFIHERSSNANAAPLLLLHGWPDSFLRYRKVIPLLRDAFHLVVPSLPGFGFSQHVALSAQATAPLMHTLMQQLGYADYAIGAGDLGVPIAMELAIAHAEAVTALHLTEVNYPTGKEDPASLSPDEQRYVAAIGQWMFSQGAYIMVHGTKPLSLAPGLNDSPAGLAAWILSFIDTSAEKHDVEKAFGSRNDLLTNLTLYWATQTIETSIASYKQNAAAAYAPNAAQSPRRSAAPANIALFPRSEQFPREWAERTLNVRRYTKMPRGGHFAALEEPALYAGDVLEALG
jgi:pimeloyl-ACP methyl ester carboxylesterase